MKNIDFLPESYRRKRVQRRAYAWEIGVIVLFGSVVMLTFSMQLGLRWQVSERLATLDAPFRGALENQNRYMKLQTDLSKASEAAELYLFLEHPWPRTQVLRSVAETLPGSISLTQLHVTNEASSLAAAPTPSDEALAKLSPAQRDLDRLRRESTRRQAVVWIAGVTDDAAQVHEFTKRLATRAPFESVKLESVDSNPEGDTRQTTFRLRGVLKPGYGQPGGPSAQQASPSQQPASTHS